MFLRVSNDTPPPLDLNSPEGAEANAHARKRGLVVLAILTPIVLAMFGPHLTGLPGAGSAGDDKVAGHTSGPYTNQPGTDQDTLTTADTGGAFAAAVHLVDVDTAHLSNLPGTSLAGTQRTLHCEPDQADRHTLACTVWSYQYIVWNGAFQTGHDTIVKSLTGPCQFSYANRDWTPEQGSSRQEQATCPGRPNLIVHWTPGQWTRYGILACDDTWYNASSGTTASITQQVREHDWYARAAIAYTFTVDL